VRASSGSHTSSRTKGIDAYGFDIVSETFKKAGVKPNDHFVQASADRIPMADGTFDAATSNWSVFYYFERRFGRVSIEEVAPESRGTISFVRLRVRGRN